MNEKRTQTQIAPNRCDFDGVKVFSATKMREREELGDVITRWLETAAVELVDREILQSSDSEFHCLTVVLFYRRTVRPQSAHDARKEA